MLVAWMAYAAALSAMVAGCALALDRVAEIWGLARRTVWISALSLAVLIPVVLAVRPTDRPATLRIARDPADRGGQIAAVVATPVPLIEAERLSKRFLINTDRLSAIPPLWGRFAATAWGAGSLVLVAMLLCGAVSLSRRTRRWQESIVDRHEVLVTPDVGPAVIGVFRPRILMPSWAMALSPSERELMLDHEVEHLRGRDPVLIAIAAWIVALFPWNPAVWFIARRLRLAIEIDCDARVLARRDARVHDYGTLLLAVGARSSNALRFSASLAEPRHFLEHRILAMTNPRPSRPLLASIPFAAIAMFAAIAVAQTPRPESTLVVRPAPVAAARTPTAEAATLAPAGLTEAPPRVGRRLVPLAARPSDQERLAASPEIRPLPAELVPLLASEEPIGIDVVRSWIQLHHPNVIAGDPHVNSVVIVVDRNNQYLASVTDSVASQIVGTDSSLRVPFGTTIRRAGQLRGEPTRSPSASPIFIVDGVRVGGVEQLDSLPIRNVEVVKGPAAAAEYGPDAENGVVIVRTMLRPSSEQLSRLGIAAENIHEMTELHVKEGVVGPNRMFIAIIRLKSPRG